MKNPEKGPKSESEPEEKETEEFKELEKELKGAEKIEIPEEIKEKEKSPEEIIGGFEKETESMKNKEENLASQIADKKELKETNIKLNPPGLEKINAEIDKDITESERKRQELSEEIEKRGPGPEEDAIQKKIENINEKITELEKNKQVAERMRVPTKMIEAIDKDIEELNKRKEGNAKELTDEKLKRIERYRKEKEEVPKEKEGRKEGLTEKQLLFQAKLEQADIPEKEKGEIIKTLRFVESKEIKETHQKEIGELVDILTKEAEYPIESPIGRAMSERKGKLIETLSESLNLPKEILEQSLNNQNTSIQEIAQQRFQAERAGKKKGWKKFLGTTARLGLYVGGGLGLSVFTGGVAAGITLGAARMTETWIMSKRNKEEKEKAQKEMRQLLASDSEEAQTLKEEFQTNIFAELAVAKQQQTEGKEKIAAEKETYLDSIRKYLKETEKGLSDEEIEKKVGLIGNLVELENKENFLESEYASKNKRAFSKILNGLDKTLGHPIIAGGKEPKEKLLTAGVFSVAGILARSCPVVRNIMLGYAGMKIGETIAGGIIRKSKGFEVLRRVSTKELKAEEKSLADVDEETLILAKSQLLDKKFKKENPSEYAKLKEQIFAIERAKLEKTTDYTERANKNLEGIMEKKISKERKAKIIKVVGATAGAAAGFFALDAVKSIKGWGAQEEISSEPKVPPAELEEELPKEAQVSEVPPVEEVPVPEVSGEVTIEKGDTVWGILEKQSKERGYFEHLSGTPEEIEAQKTYIIDALKDKAAEDPTSIGLEKGADIHTLKLGQELDFSKLFESEEAKSAIEESLEKAKDLTPDQIKAITENNEFLEKVLTQPTTKVSNEQLLKAIEITGGREQGITGLVKEANNRIEELSTNLPEQAKNITQLQEELAESTNKVIQAPDKETLDTCLANFETAKENLAAAQESLREQVSNYGILTGKEEALEQLEIDPKVTTEANELVEKQTLSTLGEKYEEVTELQKEFNEVSNNYAKAQSNLGTLRENRGFFSKLFGLESKEIKIAKVQVEKLSGRQVNVLRNLVDTGSVYNKQVSRCSSLINKSVEEIEKIVEKSPK